MGQRACSFELWGRQCNGASIGPAKARRRKGQKPKRRNASIVRRRDSAGAGLLTEVAQLRRELHEAREQQTATADVLKVISRSTFDLQTVLDTLVESAARLCEADMAQIMRPTEAGYYVAARYGFSSEYVEYHKTLATPSGRASLTGRVLLEGKAVQIPDVLADPEYSLAEPQRLGGYRTHLGVPLLRDGSPIGVILVSRRTVRPFDRKQIELVTTFADQAVIAIENTGLFNELRQRTADLSESLEQQTATSEVLRVIGSSPGDLKPVFDALLEKAMSLCEAAFGGFWLYDGERMHATTMRGVPALFAEFHSKPLEPVPGTGSYALVHGASFVHVPDITDDDGYRSGNPAKRALGELGGARTALWLPLRKDDALLGTFMIYRQEVRPFTDKQISLLQDFAAQAVIAIENTRLLNELRESLEQQTATADVLGVISSSPGELEPVFQEMLKNAVRICDAKFGVLYRFDGAAFHFAAEVGTPSEYLEFNRQRGPFQPVPGSHLERVMLTKRMSHTPDDAASKIPGIAARLAGARTQVIVPMLKEDELIGAIVIYRQEVRPFTDKQIALVQNFAAQAVIAIENTRLLNELRESLQQQTATAEVLRVVSSSSGELEPVFQSLLDNATRLCVADFGLMAQYDGNSFQLMAQLGGNQDYVGYLQRGPFCPGPETLTGRVLRARGPVQIEDFAKSTGYLDRDPLVVVAVERGGVRTTLGVPMLRENELIGVISLYRQEVRLFTDKQIELLQNFAAQAQVAGGGGGSAGRCLR